MTNILFITSEKNQDIIENYINKFKDNIGINKKLIGIFEINEYTKDKISYFENFTFLILDRLAFKNKDQEFIEAIRRLNETIEKTRLIILWQGLNTEDEQGTYIIKHNIRNLVVSENISINKEELEEAMSEKGIERYQTLDVVKKSTGEKYIFYKNNFSILIMNTDHRMLATSYALSMANYFAKIGGNINYITIKPYEEILIIKKLYEKEKMPIEDNILDIEQDDGTFKKVVNGFHYLDLKISTDPQEESEITILDISGIKTKDLMQMKDYIRQADKILLFTEVNEWQKDKTEYYIKQLVKIKEEIAFDNNLIDIIVINSKKEEIEKNIKIFNDIQPKILEKEENIFDYRKNRNYYYALIEKQIIGIATN